MWKRSVVAAAALLLWSLPAQAARITLSYAELSGAINEALKGVQLRLNNLGPFQNGSHRARDTSYVIVPGRTIARFDIEPYEAARSRGRVYTYYVSDVTSQTISASTAEESFQVDIDFALKPAALVERCVQGTGKRAVECPPSAWYPDLGLTQAQIRAKLTPIAHRNSLAFEMTDLTLAVDVSVGLCDYFLVGPLLCTYGVDIEKLKADGRALMRKKIIEAFNETGTRDRIADAVARDVLKGFVRIRSIKVLAGEIVIDAELRPG